MYRPTESRREKPVHTELTPGSGRRVAVGGDIVITPKPPKLPRTIKEATQEEYEILFNRGFIGVEFIEDEAPLEEKPDVQDSASDTEGDDG